MTLWLIHPCTLLVLGVAALRGALWAAIQYREQRATSRPPVDAAGTRGVSSGDPALPQPCHDGKNA